MQYKDVVDVESGNLTQLINTILYLAGNDKIKELVVFAHSDEEGGIHFGRYYNNLQEGCQMNSWDRAELMRLTFHFANDGVITFVQCSSPMATWKSQLNRSQIIQEIASIVGAQAKAPAGTVKPLPFGNYSLCGWLVADPLPFGFAFRDNEDKHK